MYIHMSYIFFFCVIDFLKDLLPDSLESLGRCWLRRLELQQRQSAEQTHAAGEVFAG